MGGSKERIYLDLQVQPLMDEPEKWYKSAMREAYKNIPYGMRSVLRQYSSGMLEARGMFNDGFLTSLGYNPKENIKYRVVDPDLVLSWAKSNINISVSSVHDYKFATPTMEELALEYIQNNYSNMNLDERSFYQAGVKWYIAGVTVVSSMGSDATCFKNKETTVNLYAVANGTTVVSISDTIVTISGVNYWSAVLGTGPALVPVVYMTISCPGVNSEIISNVITTYDGRVYPYSVVPDDQAWWYSSDVVMSVKLDVNGELEIKATTKNVKYDTIVGFLPYYYTLATKDAIDNTVSRVKKEIEATMSGLVERLVFKYILGGVEKIMIAEIAESEVSGVANAKAYPIIPLRENYSFVNETNSMKAVLNKLGMNASDFASSLNDSRIKNAAIVFVVNINDSSKAGTKYVFETLIGMVDTTVAGARGTETSYHLDYGFSDVDMKTKVWFTSKFVEGNIGEVGEYSRSTEGGSYQVWDSESYTWVTVGTTYRLIRKQINSVYYQELKITQSTTNWTVGGYSLGTATYLPVVDIGLNMLSYEDLCYILASSTSMVTVAITSVKSKWYQSGFFKFVMTIIITVAVFYTAGAAWWAYGLLAAAVVVAGGVVSLMNLWGADTGTLGMVIGIAAILVGGYTSLMSATAPTGQVLPVASTMVQLASVASEFNLQGTLASIEKQRAAKQAELEANEDVMEEMYDSMQSGLWLGVSDRSPELMYAMSSTQMMCNYDILYDYDGMYEGKIRSVGI